MGALAQQFEKPLAPEELTLATGLNHAVGVRDERRARSQNVGAALKLRFFGDAERQTAGAKFPDLAVLDQHGWEMTG